MAWLTALAVICSAALASAQQNCSLGFADLCAAQAAFSSGGLLSLIGGNFTPNGTLGVSYPPYPNVSAVASGQQLDASQVSSPPLVSLNTTSKRNFFNRGTLVVVDPDATNSSALYWLVENVAVNYTTSLLSNGTVIAPYIAPSPNSTTERLVFLLYNQFNNYTLPAQYAGLNTTTLSGGRLGFNLTSFAAAGLGSPLAGFYFNVSQSSSGSASSTQPGTIAYITRDGTTLPTGSAAAARMAIRDRVVPTGAVVRRKRV